MRAIRCYFYFPFLSESANGRFELEQASGVTTIEQIRDAEGPVTHPTQITPLEQAAKSLYLSLIKLN